MISKKSKSYLDYMDKTFLEELNYKIWSTKGARFNASERLIKQAKLSNICTSTLSVYLIAIGLLSVYNLEWNIIDDNLIAYSVTCLSILLLVFTQLENSKDFAKKAKEFHDCALELSKLYNRLRIYKTLTNDVSEKDKKEFTEELSLEYQKTLEKHENHSPIDHDKFRMSKPEYHKLSKLKMIKMGAEYYFKTSFIYHILITLPLVLIYFLM